MWNVDAHALLQKMKNVWFDHNFGIISYYLHGEFKEKFFSAELASWRTRGRTQKVAWWICVPPNPHQHSCISRSWIELLLGDSWYVDRRWQLNAYQNVAKFWVLVKIVESHTILDLQKILNLGQRVKLLKLWKSHICFANRKLEYTFKSDEIRI